MTSAHTPEVAELVRASRCVVRWLGKAVADDAFANCVSPSSALADLLALEAALEKVKAA